MWQLHSDQNGKRIYKNSSTNSECIQQLCYTDKEGNKWYEFIDLVTIPFTRTFAANKISSLYALGLSMEDANNFFAKHKATLKSKDVGEKYEQAYAEVLEFENKFKTATDPVKQMSSLVCVYFTINDEPIDSFVQQLQLQKMSLLENDFDMHSFFLTRQITLIENYKSSLSSTLETASAQKGRGLSALLQ